jgi:acetolactate synthase-1/2/3 large subunit
MASDYTVGDLVAEFLAACGVTTVFGIASVHNIPMLDAIGRRNTVRFMMTRGELGGAHMADGFARVNGGLGVILSSTGPGAANAVGGLIEARFAGSPVLHITGQTATRFADRELGNVHDAYDQLGMLASVSKAAYRIRSPQNAIGVLTRAAAEALSAPMGPVSVEVPIDLQRQKIDRPAVLDNFVLPVTTPRTPMRWSLMNSPPACWRRSVRCSGLATAPSRPDQRRRGCWTWDSAWSAASTAAAPYPRITPATWVA